MNFFSRLSRKFAWAALALICAGSFAFMFYASRTDSAIMDELAHIPAGYGYVHNLDYRLNPEHPPLVKALAMLPVLFLNPTFPTNIAAWTKDVNGEWAMGAAFLYNSGNDAEKIIDTARIFPILLTILLIILVYLFARRLMGNWWALLPAFLIAWDPTTIAQGHYVTTDVGAAFGVLLSLFFYTRYIEYPTTKNLWLAGVTFGIAMIAKFSTPLLIPLYIFLTLVLITRDKLIRTSGFWKSFIARFWKLLLIGVIGYLVIVYPVYFLFTRNYPMAKQVSDTTAILGSFGNGPTPAGQICHGMRCLADLDITMAHNPILRPFGEYFLGLLMALQRSDGGNTIYFFGHVVDTGGAIYFPLLYLLKEPIPTLIIAIMAFLIACWWTLQRIIQNKTIRKNFSVLSDYIGVSFSEFAMGSFVVLYWTYSIHSPLNIGLRHVLPTLPLIAILSAGVWKKWIMRFDVSSIFRKAMAQTAGMTSLATVAARSLALSAAKYVLLVALVIWLFFETIFAAPYFLSYFNEFGGGVSGGYHWVTDSNYDWGQDLLRLKTFVTAHPEIGTIAVDYFGGGNPHYELGEKEVNWSSSKGNPSAQGIQWLAVSVNTLEGAIAPLGPGETRNASDTYSWLTAIRPPAPGMGNVPPPDYRVGTSIFVYHL